MHLCPSPPQIKGASLVKGIPFSSDDPEVAGADIFAQLVPLEAHAASSMYSEEKVGRSLGQGWAVGKDRRAS